VFEALRGPFYYFLYGLKVLSKKYIYIKNNPLFIITNKNCSKVGRFSSVSVMDKGITELGWF